MVGLVASAAPAYQQSRAADRKLDIAGRERQAREAEQEARARLTRVERANALLGSVFHDLDPHSEEKEGKPLREILGDRS